MGRGVRPLLFLAALPCIALFAYIVLFIASGATGKVLFRSMQPKGVSYHSYDPYELRLQEGSLKMDLLGSHRITDLWVAKTRSPDYGHCLSIDLGGSLDNTLTPVKRVDWKDDGIDVHFSSGHRLFIPKAAFIGGR